LNKEFVYLSHTGKFQKGLSESRCVQLILFKYFYSSKDLLSDGASKEPFNISVKAQRICVKDIGIFNFNYQIRCVNLIFQLPISVMVGIIVIVVILLKQT